MAPVLGIPVVSRPDLLRACLASIDLDVRLVVIDNSGTGELGDVAADLRPDAVISEPIANLGYTASVNHIIRSFPDEPAWYVANADTVFAPGDLARPGEADLGPAVGALRHDADLERVVLGAVMLNPAVRDELLEAGVTPGTFYRPAHTLIWEAVDALADSRERIDPTTVAAHLAAAGTITQIGGHAYLHTCIEACSSPWAAKKAADQLVALATLRALVGNAREALDGGEAPADNDGAWSHAVWSWDGTRLLIEEDGEYLIIGRKLK